MIIGTSANRESSMDSSTARNMPFAAHDSLPFQPPMTCKSCAPEQIPRGRSWPLWIWPAVDVVANVRSFGMVAKAAHRVVERLVDGRIQIFFAPCVRRAIDDKLRTGHREIHADAVVPAVQLVPMRSLDGDVTGEDWMSGLDELLRSFSHVRVDCIRAFQLAIRDLNGNGHEPSGA